MTWSVLLRRQCLGATVSATSLKVSTREDVLLMLTRMMKSNGEGSSEGRGAESEVYNVQAREVSGRLCAWEGRDFCVDMG